MIRQSYNFDELLDKIAVHPGQLIKDELEARGWSPKDLATKSGCSEKTLNRVLSSKANLSPRYAEAISDAFGVSDKLLKSLQISYNRAIAKYKDVEYIKEKISKSPYPMREMIERGWLIESSPDLLDLQMIRFFEVGEPDQIPFVVPAYAAKKADYSQTNPAQLAWLFRVRQLARLTDAPRYSKRRLQGTLAQLRELMLEAREVKHVHDLLLRCGVRLVVVETLKGAKICGATSWLSKSRPVIGLTTRYDRIDNFWFVLRHEIEHVLRNHGIDKPLLDGDYELNTNAQVEEHEAIANKESLEFAIPQDKFNHFIKLKGNLVSVEDIIEFAKEQKIHPGIVAGRLKRHRNKRNVYSELNSTIRSHLIENQLCDGWGKVAPIEL